MPRDAILNTPVLAERTNNLREKTVQLHKSMNYETIQYTTQLWVAATQKSPQGAVHEIKESFTLKVARRLYSVRQIPDYQVVTSKVSTSKVAVSNDLHSVGCGSLHTINEEVV